MAIPHSDKLIKRAEDGDKLTTKERRFAVTYLMATEPDRTNVSMADLFQVTERTIRDDKVYIREERAKFIREDDISLVIADIALNFDRQMRDIEAAKRSKECRKGSRTYLEYCKALFNMELQKVTALQSLGYYPRNLGTLTEQKFEFTASLSMMEGGVPAITPTRAAEDQELIEAEFSDVEDEGPKLLSPPDDEQEDETPQAS